MCTFQIQVAWTEVVGCMGMALTKNSPYTPFIKSALTKITDAGLIAKLKAKHDSKAICHTSSQLEEGTPLSWKKLFALYLIMAIGIVIAFITLFLELLKKKMVLC